MNQKKFVIILYQITHQLISMKKHIFELPNIIMDYLHEVVITTNTYTRGLKQKDNRRSKYQY
jgi:hypothetical protein